MTVERARRPRLLAVVLLTALYAATSGSAQAADASCVLSYETFETAVPHLDAESCPDKSMNDKAFCRIAVGGDKAHVFYFSSEGNRCLIKVRSFDDEEIELKFKR